MIIKKKFQVYVLTDAQGNSDIGVVNEGSDTGLHVGGYDKDGEYHSYDANEAWYVYMFADKHGFSVKYEDREIDVEVPDVSADARVVG